MHNITVPEAMNSFIEHRNNRNLSKGTMDQYKYQLRDRWFEWRKKTGKSLFLASIDVNEFNSYFSYLAEKHVNKHNGEVGLSANTIASAWRVLRTFWRYCERRKWLSEEQAEFFKRGDDLIAKPLVPERIRPQMADDVLEALLQQCLANSDLELRARNRAMLLVLAESGCRISELAGMKDGGIDLEAKCCSIIGKGNREEWIFWGDRANKALKIYLDVRRIGTFGGDQPVWRKTNRYEGICIRAIRRVIRELAEEAEVDIPFGAPVHSIRHRFAHKAIDKGIDISQVSQMMRHRSITTTGIYLRESKSRLRKLHDKLG